MNAASINVLVGATRTVGLQLIEGRETANREARRAIRGLQKELVAVLGGGAMRGMPNLMPDAEHPFRGFRVNASGKHGSSEFIPKDGRAVLVLTEDGHFVKAAWRRRADGQAVVACYELVDEEYRADLVEPYVRAVQEALEGHLVRSENRLHSYQSASTLAAKILEAIGLRFR